MFVSSLALQNAIQGPEKDLSRPFFERKRGQLAIYVSVHDVKARNLSQVGSRLYFSVLSLEGLINHLNQNAFKNLVHLKEALGFSLTEPGVVLEEILHGLKNRGMIRVSCESEQGLNHLWRLYSDRNELQSIFQKELVTPESLDKIDVEYIKLSVRLWSDEVTACRKDLAITSSFEHHISECVHDKRTLSHIQKFHSNCLPGLLHKIRDIEIKFSKSIGEFIDVVKNTATPAETKKMTIEALRNIRLKADAMKPSKARTLIYFEHALDVIRDTFQQIKGNITCGLYQFHLGVLTEKQQELRKNISQQTVFVENLLSKDSVLNDFCFAKWQSRVLEREKKVVMGAVSIIPYCLETAIDIDYNIDRFVEVFGAKELENNVKASTCK